MRGWFSGSQHSSLNFSDLSRRKILRSALSGASISITGLAGCSAPTREVTVPKDRYHAPRPSDAMLQSLQSDWKETIEYYLQQPLWDKKNRYDAGHFLMIPLHSAFNLGIGEWVSQIRSHMRRFLSDGIKEFDKAGFRDGSPISMLQYLYLYSRYLVLETKYESIDAELSTLPKKLVGIIRYLWEDYPASHWVHDDFRGMKKRLEWKLSLSNPNQDYYQSIFDDELFLFGISADLYQYYSVASGVSPDTLLEEILQHAHRVYQKCGSFQLKEGWLFQPGVLSDHPDYLYACHKEKNAGIEPCEIPNIAKDSSHSRRQPLLIRSLIDAFAHVDQRKYEFFRQIRTEYIAQFLNSVLVDPTDSFPTYRSTNYMDGRNGLYRWEYETQGENNGYGPFELSGSLTFGWWSFLHDSDITEFHSELYRSFPLSDDVIETYVGPGTSRDRNELVTDPDSYQNGLRELIVGLASTI